MDSYGKIWGIAFASIVALISSLMIYSAATSESRTMVIQTAKTLDPAAVKNIVIVPSNSAWEINLLADTLAIDDKDSIRIMVNGLKVLNEKYLTKGAKRFWECYLIINLKQSHAGLKDKKKITFKVINTNEGLFVEIKNVMGYQTYSCQQLKPVLERLTNYQAPVGGWD